MSPGVAGSGSASEAAASEPSVPPEPATARPVERSARGDAMRRRHGLGHATAGGDMVFLDQEGVVQADAVVVAAAAGDRVLLRQAQAGQGLAGVEQPHLGAFHQVGQEARAGPPAASSR